MKSNLSSIRFAAFIMTFERAHLIKETIDNLLEQSHPPEKILIIDNSISTKTQILIQELNNPKLEYFRVGKNSGPAGAAKIGLEILSEEGFEWIYWGDDDDPPFFKDNFQILLSMAVQIPNCGCVGAVGQYFNKKNGLIVRVEDDELNKEGAIRVDNIAGNMSKIVNAEVIRKNQVLPDTTLFFGLEELDFDLALAKAGYALYADRQLYKRYRIDSNRLGVKTTRGGKKDSNKLLRDYYSTRNGLFIFRKNRLNMALIFNLCRAIFKIGMGYKYGANYGKRHSKYIWTGVVHFLQGKKGKFVFP